MRRMLMMLAVASVAALAGAFSARADRVYHSQHLDLMPVAGAPLRSGFVENIHANGPNIYAHEQYVLNGAQPNTSYQVVISIFPQGSGCTGSPLAVIPTAVVSTNVAGNGSAFHVFTPADADGLRGNTLDAMWVLMNGSTAVYETACGVIVLD